MLSQASLPSKIFEHSFGVFCREKEHLFQVLSKNRYREGKMAEFLQFNILMQLSNANREVVESPSVKVAEIQKMSPGMSSQRLDLMTSMIL